MCSKNNSELLYIFYNQKKKSKQLKTINKIKLETVSDLLGRVTQNIFNKTQRI